MAVIAIDSAAFERILSELWNCLNESSQIAINSDVLDRLIKDQFENSELNEIGREFLIGSYKDSLLEKTSALEESLQLVLDQLRKLSTKSRPDKTVTGQLLSVSADCPVTVPAAQEVTRCLSCRAACRVTVENLSSAVEPLSSRYPTPDPTIYSTDFRQIELGCRHLLKSVGRLLEILLEPLLDAVGCNPTRVPTTYPTNHSTAPDRLKSPLCNSRQRL